MTKIRVVLYFTHYSSLWQRSKEGSQVCCLHMIEPLSKLYLKTRLFNILTVKTFTKNVKRKKDKMRLETTRLSRSMQKRLYIYIYNKPLNNYVEGGKLNVFTPKSRQERDKCVLSPLSFKIGLEVLTRSVRGRSRCSPRERGQGINICVLKHSANH